MKNQKINYGKLPKVFKKKWVKALRDGEFEQGEGQLHCVETDGEGNKHDTYCCLGVACIISGHTNSKLKGQGTITPYKKWNVPNILIGYGNIGTLVEKLAEMNDGNLGKGKLPKSFKQIATWIEKNL